MTDPVSRYWWEVRKRQEFIATCLAVLDGRIGILEGAGQLGWPEEEIFDIPNTELDDDCRLLRMVIYDTDFVDSPTDPRLREIVDFYRSDVLTACRNLIRRFHPKVRLIEICLATLDQRCDLILGARAVRTVYRELDPAQPDDPDFSILLILAETTEDLPVGENPAYWAPDIWQQKCRQIAEAEDLYRVAVEEACRQLCVRFQPEVDRLLTSTPTASDEAGD